MKNNNLPLSEIIINLIQINSESLAKDLKQYLENNNKLSEFKVIEFYPLLYDSLIKELLSQFDNFNKNQIYTKEIESDKFNASEKRNYYVKLYLDTVSKLMTFK